MKKHEIAFFINLLVSSILATFVALILRSYGFIGLGVVGTFFAFMVSLIALEVANSLR